MNREFKARRQQTLVLAFIKSHMAQSGGVSPTYQQIAEGVGIKSKSHVSRVLDALQDAGKIHRLRQRACGIQIVGEGVVTVKTAQPVAREEDVLLPTIGTSPHAIKHGHEGRARECSHHSG